MADFWKKTAELYTPFIEYPLMEEKLLARPPFKYIFHIFLSSNKKTSFGEGLVSNSELEYDYYDKPEKKMSFLKKLFDFVYKLISKPSRSKPEFIIQGKECEKTNLFLQDMYEAALSGRKFSDLQRDLKPQQDKDIRSNIKEDSNERNVPEIETKKEVPAKNDLKGKIGVTEFKPETQKNPILNKENNPQKDAEKKLQVEIVSNQENSTIKKEVSNNHNGINKKAKEETTERKIDIDHGTNDETSIAEIKMLIEKISQNVNPLGKFIEFIDDDFEAMIQEYKQSHLSYKESENEYKNIEQDIEQEMTNLTEKLMEVEDSLYDIDMKINSSKARIAKNSIKINSLINKLF